jgi:hypothetical protein
VIDSVVTPRRITGVGNFAAVASQRPSDSAWSITARMTTKPMKSVAKISARRNR